MLDWLKKSLVPKPEVPVVTESFVATNFLALLVGWINDAWPAFTKSLSQLGQGQLGVPDEFLTDNEAKSELLLLVLAGELQALQNVIGGQAAGRIRMHILDTVGNRRVKNPNWQATEDRSLIDIIGVYEQVEFEALAGHKNPIEALGLHWAKRVGMKTKHGGQACDSVVASFAITMSLTAMFRPWWKMIQQSYSIKPD